MSTLKLPNTKKRQRGSRPPSLALRVSDVASPGEQSVIRTVVRSNQALIPTNHTRVDKATDTDLVYVEGLNHVKYLYAGGCQISDAGLEHSRNLTEVHPE